ncbi:tripartite motif-containing protein 54 [Syngnathoides biaculeatus]|uniref:tripartite motif-containing protein 54 n=1 Tax=Syngnathoides biaculeatus TaxID=300417 RepID=UPI002ADD7DFA|nr:tripartite motif-containing protein 54 [Syngnathoides biaculeatus]XP_061667686.1 tripartite motif-containing protein 54 [Syngnathoides biaculeatus]XP_061667687.1 tripartite motif-containing protein 54 [Syngnathoides biaculeatus]XP_061667688.1 tripartite motif-containing protein 54 [Syngnathoides biaculeatus]
MNLGLEPAGVAGRSMEDLHKQLLCPVCLEMFTKPVVILPCQHNLCRKCANDVFQSSNPSWQSRSSSGLGSRFRCPSCRHEVVLDRHGVYGLQRNLLVENIIDVYRRNQDCRPASVKPESLTCDEHHDEKINIYCLSCQTPTCSMCKVFGRHKECDVAPLASVYIRLKTELSDSIAGLVACNDNIQAAIMLMEGACDAVQENGRRRREELAGQFETLTAVLDERKQELVAAITREQDEELQRLRRVIGEHGQRLEDGRQLVETAVHAADHTHAAVFIQNVTVILDKMSAYARHTNVLQPQTSFDDMSHFVIDVDDVADVLNDIRFRHGEDDLEAD